MWGSGDKGICKNISHLLISTSFMRISEKINRSYSETTGPDNYLESLPRGMDFLELGIILNE